MNSDLITEIKPSRNAPLFGFWYPACLSSELAPNSLKGTVLLGLPILVCKTSQGAIAAMRDICPHRGMPLSFGKMKGDCVECAYHGWQFDQAGRCREIPALVENSPIRVDKIGITTYACRERDGYVWVFIPDPQQPNVIGLHHRRRHRRIDGPGSWTLCASKLLVAQPGEHPRKGQDL
jgi:phenylpropionate dioxygenase-like ring-hydroxylating dioxygenase large terminal subunit